MSLKKKFFKQIFPPLIFSVFLTASISSVLIMCYHYITISKTKNVIIESEQSDMTSFANTTSYNIQQNMKNLISDMEMIMNYAEHIYPNKSVISEIQSPHYINAKKIANNSIQLQNLSGYDKTTGLNHDNAMWYLPENNDTITDTLSKEHFSFFSEMDFFLRAIYSSNLHYKLIYGFFEDNGLQYVYPSYKNPGYVDFISNDSCEYTPSGKVEFFDMRCRSYTTEINQFMKSPNLTNTIMISTPYFYFQSLSFGITICTYNIKNSSKDNFTLINPDERKLNYAFCIDFDLQELVGFQDIFALKELYFFILFKKQVFYHPFFLKMRNSFEYNSITEYEFEVNDLLEDPESIYFNKTLLTRVQTFYDGVEINSSEITEYTKKHVSYIATIGAVAISRNGENANVSGFVSVIVEPKNLIFQKFDENANKTAHFIVVQVVIFMIIIFALVVFSLFLINYTVHSIITPITDLCDVVQSMTNGDFDADVTKNFTPNSEEINQLYQSFSKLKFIMNIANDQFFSGNDAQALINYSNALNLYLELNQKEGVGITYNNIGNIHLKNERYGEAISCYRMAVKTIEEELDTIFKENAIRQTIYYKKSSEDEDLESNKDSKIYFTKSRRRNDKMKLQQHQEKIPDEKINQMNEMYCNRLYQLATTLYAYTIKEGNIEKWQEILTLFKKIIDIDSKTQGNNARIIQCLIYVANCYLEIGEPVASLKYLQEAENSISVYEKVEKILKLSPEIIQQLKNDCDNKKIKENLVKYQGLTEKFQGKADILKQGLMYHYGIFYKKVGRYKLACIMFTKSIEIGKIYDPFIRKKCLESLSNLLASQNLLHKAPNITNILTRMDDVNNKDIVFLLDYSESMGEGARIQYAIRNFAKIFDKYVKNNDKICFIRFNLNCEIVFELTPKKNNTLQLRRQIENSFHPAGKTAFYDALDVAFKQFPNYNDYEGKNLRRKWIVSLTDGEDNSSQLTLKKVKSNLKSSNINLIIVGMGLSKDLTKDLKDLCKTTKDGAFIESPNNDDLDVAFEAISQIIYGQNLIVETF